MLDVTSCLLRQRNPLSGNKERKKTMINYVFYLAEGKIEVKHHETKNHPIKTFNIYFNISHNLFNIKFD